MKNRITLVMSILSLILMSGVFAYSQEVSTKKLSGTEKSLEDYSRMTKKRDRVDALAKESPQSKSILWRQHLAYYGAKLDLNEEQRDFLTKFSNLIDENFFVTLTSVAPKGISESEFIKTEQGQRFGDSIKQIPNLFRPEQSRQLFLIIGDISTLTDLGCGNASKENTKENNKSESLVGSCNCVASFCGSGCYPPNSDCQMNILYPCSETAGCGCFGHFTCQGECKGLDGKR